MTKNRFNSGF